MMIISWKGREKIFLSVTAVIILCILAGYAGKEADPNPANSSTMPVQEVGNIESDQIISEQEGFDFFAEYRMERERMRSREVETLKEVINKEDCSQDAKDAAALRLVKISENVEKEVKTESLIKSQGFKDCVVIIQNETTTVVVLASSLRLDQEEDYTQYIPRGHYTKSEELEKYFQNMMWYGRMTFRLKSEDETRSALLITLALKQEENLKNWLKIYEPTSFLVGKSDDLSFFEYQELLSQVYGNSIKLQELSKSEDKWQEFLEQAQKLNPPQINSIPIFDEELQPDRESEIKGFRFMGQRYTLDADIFQRLIYREVKENKAGERRLLPRGLDIPAAMGSQEAVAILKDLGDWEYAKYPENMGKMQSYIDGLDKSSWTQNLYWSWLYK
jgi:hypothetical protein